MNTLIERAVGTIKQVHYQRVEGTTTTICSIETISGFVSVGQSSCFDVNNFDENAGRVFAYDNALEKLVEHIVFFTKLNVYQCRDAEFFKMDSAQQSQVINALLEASANPANGYDRGHFLNAANALQAQIKD